MKELINNKEEMFVLEEDKSGALYFTVTCGGAAMYNVCIKLNDEEYAGYLNEGEEFLTDLAYKIAKNTRLYKDRAEPPHW